MAKRVVKFTIEEDVWRKARAIAILHGTTISAVIEHSLRQWTDTEGSSGSDAEDQSGSEALGEDPEDSVRHESDGDAAGVGGAGVLSGQPDTEDG